VQHGTHFVGRQIDIRLTVVALNKTMTITVARYNALEFSKETGRCAGVRIICFDKNSLL
jgi:hypothetical protein